MAGVGVVLVILLRNSAIKSMPDVVESGDKGSRERRPCLNLPAKRDVRRF